MMQSFILVLMLMLMLMLMLRGVRCRGNHSRGRREEALRRLHLELGGMVCGRARLLECSGVVQGVWWLELVPEVVRCGFVG